MGHFLRLHDAACLAVVRVLLLFALAIDDHRRRVQRSARRLRGALRTHARRFLAFLGLYAPPPPFARRRRRPWNRTAPGVEEAVVRLHAEHPRLGAGQLRFLAERVLAFRAARETFRQILIRRRDLVVDIGEARRRHPRRVRVGGPRQLWGADLTIVWILGLLPVFVLGVIDYHGSRLVALERVRWPRAAEVARVLRAAFDAHGAPDRLLTDRGAVFTAIDVQYLFAQRGVRHIRTFPAHPWTNGRIERLFRTMKETIFAHVWLVASVHQLDRFLADFLVFYNRDRPHSAWAGRTPDEVFFAKRRQLAPLARVTYFDGRLAWYRFG